VSNAQDENTKTETIDAVAWHKSLITPDRYRGKSSVPNREIDEEALSDFSVAHSRMPEPCIDKCLAPERHRYRPPLPTRLTMTQ
jgi:hypothetical protein